MRLESRLYRTVQAERAVRGEHEQYGCPDAHENAENAHASDLHDMEPKSPRWDVAMEPPESGQRLLALH